MTRKKAIWSLIAVVVICMPFLSAQAQEIKVTASIDTYNEVEIQLATKFITTKGKESDPFLYSGEPGAKALTVEIPWKKGYQILWVRGVAKVIDTARTDEWEYCILTVETDSHVLFLSSAESYISLAEKSGGLKIKVDNTQNSDYKHKPQFYVKWAEENSRKAWRKAEEKLYEEVKYPIHIESLPWENDFSFVEVRAKWVKHYVAAIVDGYEVLTGTRITVGKNSHSFLKEKGLIHWEEN